MFVIRATRKIKSTKARVGAKARAVVVAVAVIAAQKKSMVKARVGAKVNNGSHD
jgi:hypothetical protein